VDGGLALVRVHEWVDARPVTEPSPHLARQLGSALGRLHAVPVPPEAAAAQPLAVFGADWWADLAARARAAALPWADEVTRLLPVLVDLEALVLAVPTPLARSGAGHRDADPKNCLVARGRGLLLVDWDAAGRIVPEQELAGAVLDWSGAPTEDPKTEVARALVEGYRQAGGRPVVTDERAFATWCAGTLGWLEFNLRHRVLDAAGDDPYERVLGEDEVRWAVAHLSRMAASLPAWSKLLS
jgi:Ser/Thr protein kinase RdoA (MazF antagonist)